LPFTLPQFVNTCDSERFDIPSSTWVPILAAQPCQLYNNSRIVNTLWFEFDANYVVILRVPKGTNILPNDRVEVNPGSGWTYRVITIERVHMDFPNEYLAAYLEQGAVGPAELGDILAEDGNHIVQEDGFLILTEV